MSAATLGPARDSGAQPEKTLAWLLRLTLGLLIGLGAAVGVPPAAPAAAGESPPQARAAVGCLACHLGVEPIREAGSQMLQEIQQRSASPADPQGCTVCHGGDPEATDKELAHRGPTFFPDPGSPWINWQTCGVCHPEQVRAQSRSLMMTQAGDIHGATWAFGAAGYGHPWANYAVENPPEEKSRLGTDAYRDYLKRLKQAEPQVFVDRHQALPEAPTEWAQIVKQTDLAAFSYLRGECLRCHLGVKGRPARGDHRGQGCSACHIPYSAEGLYEGGDYAVPHDKPGYPLVHSLQSSRKAKVKVHGTEYSGIPNETCNACHNRGRRVGVAFQGLMETTSSAPYAKDGGSQAELHSRRYLALHQDLHEKAGLRCQDCHTSLDVHGDGFLVASAPAAVEIECTDCHGTPLAYPWELPLGTGDEYEQPPAAGPPRGTTRELLPHRRQGLVYPVQAGYLLTARGNPFPHVVRRGNEVVVHTAAGKDLTLKPLKLIRAERGFNLAARVAMVTVAAHLNKLECYACHAAWAPQLYGSQVRLDYSGGRISFDWLAAGRRHTRAEHAADRGEGKYDTSLAGEMIEQWAFTRWEDPVLGVNGEGRVSPLVPGCQSSFTIIGPDGKPLLMNQVFRTPPELAGGGPTGQLAIDMSPAQPHTTSREVRTCEACHATDKVLGYGIGGGRLARPPDQTLIVDLQTAEGQLLPRNSRVQAEAVAGLTTDWSRIVTEDDRQLQTVGQAFPRSRPLNKEERQRMDRRGVCQGCHLELPRGSLAVSLLHHVAESTNQLPADRRAHTQLMHRILLTSAWGQVLAGIGVPGAVVVTAVWLVWRRRRRPPRSRVPPPPPELDDLA